MSLLALPVLTYFVVVSYDDVSWEARLRRPLPAGRRLYSAVGSMMIPLRLLQDVPTSSPMMMHIHPL